MTFRDNCKQFEAIKQGVTVTFSSDLPAGSCNIAPCLLIAVHEAMEQFPYTNRRVVKRWYGTRLKEYERRDITLAIDSDCDDPFAWKTGTIHSVNITSKLKSARDIEDAFRSHINNVGHETAVLIDLTDKTGVDAAIAAWPWPISFSFGQVRDDKFTLVMNFDRRIMAGAPAAKFWKCVCDEFVKLITQGQRP